ncbi:hypothetical protein [Phocaeicola plebeius]|uniref:hypothetical protein n=1 Tax=Phocaeicola plebeius TaxID=310297 RepID=UPI0022E0EA87|nr:hypothetical protein [Phocaeicola plebeius]
MKIIALEGPSNCGKTETLHIVYNSLLQNGYQPIPNAFEDLFNNDFLDVVEKSGKIIGIVTQGDYAIGKCSVKKHLERLTKFNCDTIICACILGDTKHKIKDAIMTYKPYHFLTKSKSINVNMQDADNKKYASIIMSQI